MPRNVRNFWLEADIDGRETSLEGGPVSKDGGFTAALYIRDEGSVQRAVTIHGWVSGGELNLSVTPNVPAEQLEGQECLCCADNECECNGEKLTPAGFTIRTQRNAS